MVCCLSCDTLADNGVSSSNHEKKSVQCKNILQTLNVLKVDNKSALFIHFHLPYKHITDM